MKQANLCSKIIATIPNIFLYYFSMNPYTLCNSSNYRQSSGTPMSANYLLDTLTPPLEQSAFLSKAVNLYIFVQMQPEKICDYKHAIACLEIIPTMFISAYFIFHTSYWTVLVYTIHMLFNAYIFNKYSSLDNVWTSITGIVNIICITIVSA